MKLHIYRGFFKEDENIPKDVTHIIIDDSVDTIKERAFEYCWLLVSIVMGDSVNTIGKRDFHHCHSLRFIRLSKTLRCIGENAFTLCHSLKAVCLPSMIKRIENYAFMHCQSLSLLILPNNLDGYAHLGRGLISTTPLSQIAASVGVRYNIRRDRRWTGESNHQVNDWLIQHMNDFPLHTLCYDSSVTTANVNTFINHVDNSFTSVLQVDKIHGMSPLHLLSMNPYAPVDAIASLLNFNTEAVFSLDNQQKTPLDYGREYNVGGLVGMITGLCNQRN